MSPALLSSPSILAERISSSSRSQNTDPSTKEYEATVAMVEEVEHIIRSIEDEKTAVEERVKTRDVFARIEGLEREKVSRTRVESRSLPRLIQFSVSVNPLRCSSLLSLVVSSSTRCPVAPTEPRSLLRPLLVVRLLFPSRRRRASGG